MDPSEKLLLKEPQDVPYLPVQVRYLEKIQKHLKMDDQVLG